MYCFLLLPILALAAIGNALAVVNSPDVITRADVTFPCNCVDHWFKHNRNWIRASSKDGCMALETNSTLIWALNTLPKPAYVSKSFPTLACSLLKQECRWNYSPLDIVDLAPQTSVENATDAGIGTLDKREPSQQASEEGADIRQFCEFLPET